MMPQQIHHHLATENRLVTIPATNTAKKFPLIFFQMKQPRTGATASSIQYRLPLLNTGALHKFLYERNGTPETPALHLRAHCNTFM